MKYIYIEIEIYFTGELIFPLTLSQFAAKRSCSISIYFFPVAHELFSFTSHEAPSLM
jgi:hypothetical protein